MSVTASELVAAARDYVRRAVKLELDGTVESLAYVDHYLSTVGKVSDDVLALIAPAIGAYFGELAVAHFGGHWITEGEPSEWRVVLDPAPVRFSPAAMAAEAIRGGEVEGYDSSLDIPSALEAPLAEALASSAPVDARYYHSLTGRFETIEHIVEMLVELGRIARESTAN